MEWITDRMIIKLTYSLVMNRASPFYSIHRCRWRRRSSSDAASYFRLSGVFSLRVAAKAAIFDGAAAGSPSSAARPHESAFGGRGKGTDKVWCRIKNSRCNGIRQTDERTEGRTDDSVDYRLTYDKWYLDHVLVNLKRVNHKNNSRR